MLEELQEQFALGGDVELFVDAAAVTVPTVMPSRSAMLVVGCPARMSFLAILADRIIQAAVARSTMA